VGVVRLSDPAAFAKLVADHHFLLEAFVASLTHGRGGAELVDELVQETISVAWSRFDSYERARPFGPWIRGFASLTVQARFRQEATRARIRGGHDFEARFIARLEERFGVLDPSITSERAELVSALRACVGSLKSEFAEVMAVHYSAGKDAVQAAESLGLSVETARKRLQRARSQIAACLESKGFPIGARTGADDREATV
jgi:RNA polymerase sigma factor (sigma-70 family)